MRLTVLLLLAGFVSAAFSARALALSEERAFEVEQAFVDKDYAKVVDMIGEADLSLDEDHDLIFLRAVSFAETGQSALARGDLNRYLDREGFYSDEARNLMEQLKQAAGGWDPSVLLQVGVVHDSRVLTLQDQPPFFNEDGDTAIRLRLAVDLAHESGFIGRYRGYGLKYFDQGEDRHEHALEAGLTANMLGGTLEWVGFGEASWEDGTRDFSRLGSRAEMAWLAGESSIYWLSVEGGEDTFPEADVFDGPYVLGSTGLEQYFGNTALFYDGYVLWHDAEIDPLAYLEYGGGLVGAMQWTETVGAGLSGRLSQTDFDAFDPLFDKKRKDSSWSLRAWLSYKLSETLSVVPSFEYAVNDSNIASADFDEQVVAIDFIWTP